MKLSVGFRMKKKSKKPIKKKEKTIMKTYGSPEEEKNSELWSLALFGPVAWLGNRHAGKNPDYHYIYRKLNTPGQKKIIDRKSKQMYGKKFLDITAPQRKKVMEKLPGTYEKK